MRKTIAVLCVAFGFVGLLAVWLFAIPRNGRPSVVLMLNDISEVVSNTVAENTRLKSQLESFSNETAKANARATAFFDLIEVMDARLKKSEALVHELQSATVDTNSIWGDAMEAFVGLALAGKIKIVNGDAPWALSNTTISNCVIVSGPEGLWHSGTNILATRNVFADFAYARQYIKDLRETGRALAR